MTSSKTFKKLLTLGATAILAVGGSLTAASPAQATGLTLTSAPTFTPATAVSTETSLSASYGSWANAPLGTGGGSEFWRICDSDPSLLSAVDGTDVPVNLNCQIVFTSYSNNSEFTGTGLTLSAVSAMGTSSNTVSTSSLVGKYIARISIVKLYQSPYTLYGWAFSSAKLIQVPPTMTGPSGNVNGSVGVAMSMGTYVTTGLTSPVVYSYAVAGGQSLPAGVTFDTTTGQITGTPTASASNLSVTVTATGANGLSKSSVFNYTVTGGSGGGGGGGGGGQTYTMTTSPSYAIANGVATANDGVWSGGTPSRYWLLCDTPRATENIGSPPMDCAPFYPASTGGSYERGTTLTIPTTVWQSGSGGSRTQVTFASKSLALFVINGVGNEYLTPTTGGSSVVSSTPAEAVAPIPAIIAPLLPAITAISRPMISLGGQVALSSGDFSGLTSAKIEGKSLDFILGKTGSLTFTVPNGQAGKTADLLLTFTTGTVNLQNAIKYVAPVVVADVPERSVAIVPGSKKLSEATADQVRAAAFANMSNTAVSCVAYATSNTAAAKAAAIASANAVCALATKANPNLTAAPITVVVDKVKARKVGVGIKVYKATK